MEEDSGILSHENTAWLEKDVVHGLRLWHVLGIAFSVFLCVIVLLCCCFRFRIPRTKQEIEADFVRRKICKKFRKRIQKFENSEMDGDMDLKKVALEKIRVEFIQRSGQSSDYEEECDEESHHEDNDRRLGRKKKLISGPKRLIATIYTESTSSPIGASLENGGI